MLTATEIIKSDETPLSSIGDVNKANIVKAKAMHIKANARDPQSLRD